MTDLDMQVHHWHPISGRGLGGSQQVGQAAKKMSLRSCYGKITSYLPPTWARDLKVIPRAGRVELCMKPTPIHKWALPGVPSGFQVSVKRDDLTGSTLSGNKVRKLEFLLADAIKQGCDSVITFGGLQSNHVRATVLAAREVGLQTHVMVLNSTPEEDITLTCEGNLLLNRLAGAKLIIFPTRTDITRAEHLKVIHERMKDYAQKLSGEGHKAYVIPAGGSSTLGTWGYIDAFNEMIQQGVLEDFDDLFVAAGSAGTICGLAIAKYLSGAKIKLHAVATHNTEEFIYDHVDTHLREVGLPTEASARDLVDAVMGYTGRGYAHSLPEELELIVDVCSTTGVPLDPEFCIKGVRGMLGEMKTNPGRFAGKRVLFLHSGGCYGLFDGRIDEVVKARPEANQILKSSDVFSK